MVCRKDPPISVPIEFYVSFVGLYFRKGRAVRWYKTTGLDVARLKAFISPFTPVNIDDSFNDGGILTDALTGEYVAMAVVGKLPGDERLLMQFHDIEHSELQPKFTKQQLDRFVVPKQIQDLCEEP